MTASKEKWVPGQTVLLVSHKRYSKEDPTSLETVGRVGRKWVYFTEERKGRFDKETGLLDSGGYACTGRVWLSREDYENHTQMAEKWKDIRDLVGSKYTAPDDLSMTDLNMILNILNKGESTHDDS